MAGDTVTTIFGGDDSLFAAAAARVKSAMSGIANFKPEVAFFHQARAGAEGLGVAAHGASEAIHGIGVALGPLMAGIAALAGVASVFEGFKRSLEEASKVELAKFDFTNIAGGAEQAESAIAKLEETGKETATSFSELTAGAKHLMEAGLSADEAADATERLQKVALNTGADFNELSDIYARVQTKQEITSKDLVKLAMAGIPGVAELGRQFRTLERDVTDSNRQIEISQEALERNYEATEKNASGINSFAGKVGLAKEAFSQFLSGGQAAWWSSLAQYGKVNSTLQSEFAQGLQQIAEETGISQQGIKEFADEGKLGFQDLIDAAGRYRQEQEARAKAAGEEQKFANENRLLQEQRGLVGQVSEAIKAATSEGGIFATVNNFFQTWEGKLKELSHGVEEVFVNFGSPLIDALKPALDYLNSQAPKIQEMAKGAGDALGGAIKWFTDALSEGTLWEQIKDKGAAAFNAAIAPIRDFFSQLGAQLSQAFSSLNKNNELLEGFKSLSNLLDAVADGFGQKLSRSVSQGIAGFDVGIREWMTQQWWYGRGGSLSLTPEEEKMTHAGRIAAETTEINPSKEEEEQTRKKYQEALQGITTHFPAAFRQGIEAAQMSPIEAQARARVASDYQNAVRENRPSFWVAPEQAAADYSRATGQTMPAGMSPEVGERIAQLLTEQNALLRSATTASGGS